MKKTEIFLKNKFLIVIIYLIIFECIGCERNCNSNGNKEKISIPLLNETYIRLNNNLNDTIFRKALLEGNTTVLAKYDTLIRFREFISMLNIHLHTNSNNIDSALNLSLQKIENSFDEKSKLLKNEGLMILTIICEFMKYIEWDYLDFCNITNHISNSENNLHAHKPHEPELKKYKETEYNFDSKKLEIIRNQKKIK